MNWLHFCVALFVSLGPLALGQAIAQISFEEPPINYLKAMPTDSISRLQEKIDVGEVKLTYSDRLGYLPSVLEALNIPKASQGLVFSKTSFQLRRISPRTPRALYFNDDVYVGYVKAGPVIEISAVDPKLGANFYTLSQKESDRPVFKRQTHECLQCHGSSLTRGVPGHLVRSVYPQHDGQPTYSAGTFLIDHSSPLKERWGGWYVTGKHGSQRHMGNAFMRDDENDPRQFSMDAGANITELNNFFDTTSYLTAHSDIVGLMVLEHQTNMHNHIARANFLTRTALHDGQIMNEMLGRPDDYQSASTKRRIQSAAEPLVKHLLFCDETKLTDQISGTSGFAKGFQEAGIFDCKHRTLRDFDLQTRLFKYPCSYLIYSEAFDLLPQIVLDRVYSRLWDVLTSKDDSSDFAHLSAKDRKAILEILRDTKENLPDYFQTAGS